MKFSTLFTLILTTIAALSISVSASAANPKSDFQQGNAPKRSSSGVRTEWGLTGALYFNSISFDATNIDFSNKVNISWGGGLMMAIKFGDFFAIQPEINYERAKLNLKVNNGLTPSTKHKVICNSLDIPLLASLRLGNAFRINAGPLFTLMNNCSYQDKDEAKAIFGTTRPTFGYTAGLAVVLFRRYMVDVRYIGYFKPSLCNLAGNEFDCSAKAISLKIGYVF